MKNRWNRPHGSRQVPLEIVSRNWGQILTPKGKIVRPLAVGGLLARTRPTADGDPLAILKAVMFAILNANFIIAAPT